ncbi:DUF2079 domain-containing protein [Synechococcus sp. W2B2]|uniref:DUF2079 domain-containing protein n=1 Tax=Synechococcus sp. W2B2 TaxID=3392296 RepID=UPI00006BB21E|nr:hypothetical protein WH7805_11198 [Synechococcus sp. WH 7805]
MGPLALPRKSLKSHGHEPATNQPLPRRAPAPPHAALWLWSVLLGLLAWGASALRHWLLQSNAYDLGLFDQWAWLIGSGRDPISSMEDVHVLADHGAWMFYGSGLLYGLHPSIHWLLASQALSLSLTAIPVWMLATQAGLSRRLCWFSCLLWWLQPLVFNVNLFDFHPETWIMPGLAMAIWCQRQQRIGVWLLLLALMLGCRDGLVLVTLGLSLSLVFQRRWTWAIAGTGLSGSWVLLLSHWLYPLFRNGEGPKAAGRMFSHLGDNFGDILFTLISRPWLAVTHIDLGSGAFYLMVLILPTLPFWRRNSLVILSAAVPLLLVNLNAEASSYRTLIHHYSLPLAVLSVTAAIDGMSLQPRRTFPWNGVIWAVSLWLALAKPWFFTGPYLDRVHMMGDAYQAISKLTPNDRVLTTSYLVPQISQRQHVTFAKRSQSEQAFNNDWNVFLLNPNHPGWGSNKRIQKRLLNEAEERYWTCKSWDSGLKFCRKPSSTS